jgi:hypothetical protein
MQPPRTESDESGATPQARYRERSARFAAERDRLAARSRLLSHARTAAFILVIALGLYVERSPGPASMGAALLGLAGFVALVVWHRRVRRREVWYDELVKVNEEGLCRLARDWRRLPVRTLPDAQLAGHAYADDLDLFGRASLTQILGPVGTALGAATLDGWLLARAEPAVIAARQVAVRELAGRHELREELAIRGRRARGVRQTDVARFLDWAESPPWLVSRPALRLLGYALPAATWLLIALHATGVIGSALWLLPLLAAFVVYLVHGARLRRTFDAAFGREGMFSEYPELLAVAAAARFDAPALRQLSARLQQTGAAADQQLARLRRLMHLADLRFSLAHVPVFLVTMWDVHVLAALERWQRAAGPSVRDWLTAVGELEALCALATLAHDQPAWAFAEIVPPGDGDPDTAVLDADALGHPLLGDDVRVTNDVRVGPPGTFMFVTGSNMSGKSTLLRALGTNVVLAQAGAPCCARRLRIPPLEVHTSIRVQDSLARGVSYFMAELQRLKQIVDAAQQVRDDRSATLLFLLDEILHGTNTAERRIAARRVIRHLVDSGAIGAVTTHDLELAEEPALAPRAQLVHFEESFEDDVDADAPGTTIGGTLSFDYRLRDGLATSTNALQLMRLVGLPGDAG